MVKTQGFVEAMNKVVQDSESESRWQIGQKTPTFVLTLPHRSNISGVMNKMNTFLGGISPLQIRGSIQDAILYS